MEELLEFIMYNYGKKNDDIAEKLEPVIDKVEDEEVKAELYSILAISKGYTEYIAKNISELTGITRTKVKTTVKQMLEEGKVENIVMNKTTYLVPKI